jgi:thiamine biosynthesis lipoprotein
MACRFEVTLPSGVRNGVSVAKRGLDEADRLERQLSIFKEDSELSFVNRTAALRAAPVTASLFGLLQLSQQLCAETGGAFDITSSPLSQCWGFLRRQGRIPEPEEIDAARELTGPERISLDLDTRSVRFDREGVRLNLGSIGKGYALDRIKGIVGKQVRTALISAGSSSIAALGGGDRGHSGWSVGIRHPFHTGRRLAILEIRDCAMSTSGGEEQFFELNGKRYGHIIDPRSGLPADGVISCTVVACSAAVADALATAFYVAGPALAEQYCSTHPDTFVIMLQTGTETPLMFGSHRDCRTEIIHEPDR